MTSKQGKIAVIMVDDHYLIREGIRSILATSKEIDLVAEGADGAALERLVEEFAPDIALVDLDMPQNQLERDGSRFHAFSTIAQLKKKHPDTQFIIITQHITKAMIEGAVSVGINGYLLKDDALSLHLIEAIQAVYLKGVYFSGEVSRALMNTQLAPKEKLLTARQYEILNAIIANPNWSYAQHAAHLNISEYTFSNHLRQIFERLEVNNVTAAVLKSIQMGVLQPPAG